ncbi:MAG: leucyl/phenylalanyl-tRNA--protein transferase [Betaproteobacteria bacterium]|nr:leucyl/phenylalanyl-tRNA--protein transferase [Betaproteobacteria bacterium]
MIRWLNPDDPFPPVTAALADPNGLLAAGGDLSASRLLDAYRHGVFPWFNPGQPILWWSPDPRMVLFPRELKVSRSLNKTLRNGDYEVRADTRFRAVMQACAEPRPRQDGTWITDEMIAAYGALHEQGIAHSIETWIGGELAGGLYGVALGRMFYGESMFTRAADASKIALVHLVRQLTRWNFGMIDCQVHTRHLASVGAREIPRAGFMRKLQELVNCAGKPDVEGRWELDDDLAQ